LRIEQVHQRAGVALATELGHAGIAALRGFDDAAPTQHLEPFTQRRTRDTQLFTQASLRGQRLSDLEYAIDDQPLDTLSHHVTDLPLCGALLHIHLSPSTTGRTSYREHT